MGKHFILSKGICFFTTSQGEYCVFCSKGKCNVFFSEGKFCIFFNGQVLFFFLVREEVLCFIKGKCCDLILGSAMFYFLRQVLGLTIFVCCLQNEACWSNIEGLLLFRAL